jgi:hypothetical protein
MLIALGALIAASLATEGAAAKGVGQLPASTGVTVTGSAYRYSALSPNARGHRRTVVVQSDRRGGRVSRWWYLRGDYFVPAVAYDLSPGGLSADGGTLVLTRFKWGYPPKETRFAILDTRLHLRHPRRPGQKHHPRHAIARVDLKGDFSFDAISPDGSTVYLIHRYLPASAGDAYISTYEVRALDVKSGKLLPQPIVDPEEADEKMQGLPLTRAASPDGRWAYTLYDGNGKEPFIHALDTVGRRAVCIDLPQLENLQRRFFYLLQLRTDRGGRELVVVRRRPGPEASQSLLTVDTKSFEVRTPERTATASSGLSPWPPIGIVLGCLILALCWRLRGRRGAAGRPPTEQV